MEFKILILTIILIIISFADIEGQAFISPPGRDKICYAGDKVTRIYIPPSVKSYFPKGEKGATFVVTYTGFPADAKTAMQFALSLLSNQLPKEARINVKATWKQVAETGVLASTGVTSYYGGSYINGFNPDVYYPVTVAEKITGKGLNLDSEGDIQITFNSKINWYTGIDGNTPVDKYDLVTVILHEMCHGLGFNDSMNAADSIGSYGLNSVPVIFDTFIENSAGKILIDTNNFRNNSKELYKQLTGDQLYFDGPLVMSLPSPARGRLYAPSIWASGSSIAHLDEVRSRPADALMTPFIDRGEAIHDPGKLIMSILGEIGWINTRIEHTPFTDTEQNPGQFKFNVRIKSDTLFNKDLVGLIYSFNKFTTSDTLYLTYNSVKDTFSVSLNVPVYGSLISYYFLAKDCFNRVYRLPSAGIRAPYSFYVGADTVKPKVTHTPLTYFFDKIDTIRFSALASDNIGIDSVYIEYKINTGASKYLRLKNDSLNIYSGFTTITKGQLRAGDSIRYRVVARDKANISNQKNLPSSGYYVIDIEAISSVVDMYTTDFSGGSADFVNKGFSVIQPDQFTSPALHTLHPYESPDSTDQSIEYTSVIRHPVVVNEKGMIIDFREIVLVEPGDPGSYFGQPDFFDYVILEASKNFGKTWFSLAEGYDSRISPTFENAYNSSFNGMNSRAVGREGMYEPHNISLGASLDFAKGDTLMIRFRLYSDAFAHGWGWAIDDFSIKAVASAIRKIRTDELKLYPNPGSGQFTLDTRGYATGVKLKVEILNASGISLKRFDIIAGSENLLDISNYKPGIYIIVISDGTKLSSVKYILTGH